jgi:hypothetical protein
MEIAHYFSVTSETEAVLNNQKGPSTSATTKANREYHLKTDLQEPVAPGDATRHRFRFRPGRGQ